jgi:hypothetical protein
MRGGCDCEGKRGKKLWDRRKTDEPVFFNIPMFVDHTFLSVKWSNPLFTTMRIVSWLLGETEDLIIQQTKHVDLLSKKSSSCDEPNKAIL